MSQSPQFVFARLMICLTMLASFNTPVFAATTPPPFPDTVDSWFQYRESIAFLTQRQAISGYPDGTFKPQQLVNRAEFLKIVFAARGGPEPTTGGRRCFRDVRPTAWYGPYICAASRRGIVNGYPDGTFKAEQAVTMAEGIKMVLLAYGKDLKDEPGATWYEPYTDEMDQSGMLRRSSYLPDEQLTRERAADLVARVLRFQEDRIVPNLSAGCGRAEPSSPPLTVTVNGLERSFLLTVPRSYVSHDPVPFIVAFHGRTNSNEQVRAYLGLDRAADNAIVAYPAALRKDNGSFSWADPGDKPNALRDLAFFDTLVEKIASEYCVDLDQLYVAGHSLGAWFANSVACARGGIVRGSGTVGGDSVITDCLGPTAGILMHNPHDTLASFSSTEKAMKMRVQENRCSPTSDPVEPQILKCQAYSCDGGNTVTWCPHEINHDGRGNYYPHTWPDEAAPAIVSFFAGLGSGDAERMTAAR